jgi:hypothetical protein
MALVSQYGSNTSSDRLNHPDRLRGDAVDLGLVRTRETFEFDFDVWSTTNNCAASDIRPGGDRNIWGVLYRIPDYLIDRSTSGTRKSLDAIEGPNYERNSIAVVWPNGIAVGDDVITYTVRAPQAGLQTALSYVTHILQGLRDHKAPEEYIEYVKSRIISNNPSLRLEIEGL